MVNGEKIIFARARESSITIRDWSRKETAGSIQTGGLKVYLRAEPVVWFDGQTCCGQGELGQVQSSDTGSQ
jgi:hypothetical protein